LEVDARCSIRDVRNHVNLRKITPREVKTTRPWPPRRLRAMPTPPYGRATAPWVRFCHILHSTHHSARSRRTRAVSDSTASSGRNSASSRSPALVLGCPFLSFSSTFRSRHQSLYLSSMVGYSNPEIQICKSAKDTPGTTLSLGLNV
jgi:hypothetical protein